MIDYKLFLGAEVTDECDQVLKLTNPHLLETFVSEKSEYLQELRLDGTRYLGKCMGEVVNFDDEELVEANVYSLLEKLTSDYDFRKEGLFLLAIPDEVPE